MSDKRENLLRLVAGKARAEVTPAAFFLHFDPEDHFGQAAVEKHLEFFRYTDMDFSKIQYERVFPRLKKIQYPRDWAQIPFYGLDFYAPQLSVVEGLVKALKREALVVQTLYSPFMCAGHTVGQEVLVRHIEEDPEAVQRGMQVITDSLTGFVKECIRLGVDGFYTSTQGGEAGRFSDPRLFNQCVRPYDLALMEEINRTCIFNILHICDYVMPYADIAQFVDYPGHVVNTNLVLTGKTLTPAEVEKMFGRPFMGGIDRLGVIAKGSEEKILHAVDDTLRMRSERFILGADCTVPNDTPWDNLRTAIDRAHEAF